MTALHRLALIALLLAPPLLHAANLFVRQGATGNGSDWTNACGGFSGSCAYSSLGNDTVYVADGNYSGGQITQPNTIIRKCSPDDGVSPGTSGYQSTYCDGQAVFSGSMIFASGSDGSQVLGVYRDESDWGHSTAAQNAYGIKINNGVEANTSSFGPNCPDNITISHVNLNDQEGSTGPTSQNCSAVYLGGFNNLCTGWTISRSYIHDCGHGTEIQCANCTGLTVEYTLFKNSWGKEAIRGQLNARNMTVRWCQFYNACGQGGGAGEGCTAEIASWGTLGDGGNYDNTEIYGNSFWRNRDENSGASVLVGGQDCEQGPGCAWGGDSADNTKVLNNTFAGFSGGNQVGFVWILGGSNNVCQNNLHYDVSNSSVSCSTASNNTVAGADPFVDYSTDLRLTGATAAGVSFGSPYNVDMDGVTRGADGTWDRGAFEYNAGGAPPAPTGLRRTN